MGKVRFADPIQDLRGKINTPKEHNGAIWVFRQQTQYIWQSNCLCSWKIPFMDSSRRTSVRKCFLLRQKTWKNS